MSERQISTPEEFMALRKECIAQVAFYVRQANAKLNINLEIPRVEFSLRGRVAGRASWAKNLITFNPTLLRENAEDFILQTTGHEVGHLAAIQKHGVLIKGHGKEWMSVMWNLGLPATRCHNYETNHVPSRVGKVREGRRIIEIPEGKAKLIDIGRLIQFD